MKSTVLKHRFGQRILLLALLGLSSWVTASDAMTPLALLPVTDQVWVAVGETLAPSYDNAGHNNNLSVIVDVHNQKEAEVALRFEKALIGINNRNLKTLDVSINNTISIFKTIKNHKGPLISESGIKNEQDAKFIYDKTGIKNFLIGESLLISGKPAEQMNKILKIMQ